MFFVINTPFLVLLNIWSKNGVVDKICQNMRYFSLLSITDSIRIVNLFCTIVLFSHLGYGDKAPKTLFGRVFAVLWVLIGITIFALLTGSLTNEITGIQNQPTPVILGNTVGGLQ